MVKVIKYKLDLHQEITDAVVAALEERLLKEVNQPTLHSINLSLPRTKTLEKMKSFLS